MGAVTRLDPNTTQNLASQPGASPGKPPLEQEVIPGVPSCDHRHWSGTSLWSLAAWCV